MLYLFQPPSGGCVLKLSDGLFRQLRIGQPPSGGCVLKHEISYAQIAI